MNPQQLRLYAVTDRSWLKPGETLAEVVETLLKAGVTCVQLREKEAEDALILQEARELKVLCHRYGVPFLVNDRPDLAQAVGADGVHVGQVFGSGTKHNVSQMPLETLTAICQAVDIPVVAIGGVSLDNLPLLADTGIAGVAVISGLFAADDKTEAAQAFLRQLEGLV